MTDEDGNQANVKKERSETTETDDLEAMRSGSQPVLAHE